jgi:hypothetical protein
VSPVKYEIRFYIPEDDILHSHSRENLKSYMIFFSQNSWLAGFCLSPGDLITEKD